MSDLLCLRPQQPHQPTRRAHWALGPQSTQNHTWLPCQVTTSSPLPQGMMFAKTIVQKFTPRPLSLHIPSTTLIYQQFNSSHRDASHYRRAAQSRSRPLMPMKPKKKKKGSSILKSLMTVWTILVGHQERLCFLHQKFPLIFYEWRAHNQFQTQCSIL